MSFGGNNNNNGLRPIGDPTISGNYDGRTGNETRFTDFPNNPDLYGHIDPLQIPNQRGDNPQGARDGPPLNNFAPPGQFPTGFDSNSPMNGVDGRGSLVMKDTPSRLRVDQPPIRGDLDMMVANGIVPPGPRFGGGLGDEFDDFGMPGNGRPLRGNMNGGTLGGGMNGGFGQRNPMQPPGFGGGFGAPRGGIGGGRMGGPPGFGGGMGGPGFGFC